MKILCLHDDGENKEILQSELASLLPKLQDSNADLSFEFANGPLQDSNLSTNNSSLNESPRYRFYEAEEVKDIRKANKWLAKKLDDDGPYDGVLAFSQGAVLISSFLLYRQWYDHELSPAFKFAIFISGCIPLKVLKDLGVPVPKQAEDAVAQAKTQCAEGLGPLLDHTSKARRAVFNSDDCFGLNLNKIPLELKIRIPTVHVWGENSPMFPTSVQLAGLSRQTGIDGVGVINRVVHRARQLAMGNTWVIRDPLSTLHKAHCITINSAIHKQKGRKGKEKVSRSAK